jgi:hypothetical protein
MNTKTKTSFPKVPHAHQNTLLDLWKAYQAAQTADEVTRSGYALRNFTLQFR